MKKTDKTPEETIDELEVALSLVNATLEATADGILVVDHAGKIVRFNKKFAEMWKIPGPVLETRDDEKAIRYVLDQLKDPDSFTQKIKEAYNQPDAESHDILFFKDGRVFERYSKPQKIGKETVGRVWSFRDITAFKKVEEELAYLACYDALTGLPNRRLLTDRIEMAFAHAKRHKTTMTLMFLDLDRFKMINDMLGHDVGDKVLIEAASRMKKSIREEDTVARLGGDEFVLLLPHIDQVENVGKIAERILRILGQPVPIGQSEFHVTTSIGIAIFPQDGKDLETLLKHADKALYKAKGQGRNNYQYFSPPSPVTPTQTPENSR